MQSRIPTHDLLQELAFNRFTVHVQGEKLRAAINDAANYISINHDQLAKELAKQVAIFYGFFSRGDLEKSVATAQTYLNFFDENETSKERAEALGLLGNAKTMTGSYKESELLLSIHELYTKNFDQADPEVLLGQAFAARYLALIYKRVAADLKDEVLQDQRRRLLAEAIYFIKQAIKLQQKVFNDSTHVAIDLAESFHIYGAILCDQKKPAEAIETFKEAIQCYDQFEQETQARHFMKFITPQNLGLVYLQMENFADAWNVVNNNLQAQVEAYGKSAHPDVAKSLHILGEIAMGQKKYDLAESKLNEALQQKRELYKSDDNSMVKATLNQLAELKKARLEQPVSPRGFGNFASSPKLPDVTSVVDYKQNKM